MMQCFQFHQENPDSQETYLLDMMHAWKPKENVSSTFFKYAEKKT